MLHYTLGQHPQIFVSPNKETNFFLFDGASVRPSGLSEPEFEMVKERSVTTLEAYGALFAGATARHLAIGESSPTYLMSPEVAPRIKARLPAAKLVAILRQPVDQALSLYMVQQGGSVAGDGLTEGFLQALSAGASGAERPAKRARDHRVRPLSPLPGGVLRAFRPQADQGHAARGPAAGRRRVLCGPVRFPRGRRRLPPGTPALQ